MLVDTGSSADILYISTYDKIHLPRSHIQPIATPLTGFTGHIVYPLGIAMLDFTIGTGNKTTTIKAQFTVVHIEDPSYNRLIGRPIRQRNSFPSASQHEISTSGGIGEACGNQKRARICYQASVPAVNKPAGESGKKLYRKNQLEIRAVRNGEEEDNSPKEKESQKRSAPHEELEEIPFNLQTVSESSEWEQKNSKMYSRGAPKT
ncbi:hypothetical protein LIER_05112 [Lithospermum erythrorhizon]|uniref:Peptidase A2 domain-containing protein n=1 Tax=Lithospermum erythrorhizon TaxID=34254 RepID=A0AAV3NZ92_LITER